VNGSSGEPDKLVYRSRVGARDWLRGGLALCTHPRIAQTLRASGYSHVVECEALATGVLAAIAGARAAPGGRRAAAANA